MSPGKRIAPHFGVKWGIIRKCSFLNVEQLAYFGKNYFNKLCTLIGLK